MARQRNFKLTVSPDIMTAAVAIKLPSAFLKSFFDIDFLHTLIVHIKVYIRQAESVSFQLFIQNRSKILPIKLIIL